MTKKVNAARILTEMAETYRERNVVYKDQFNSIAPMMMALFPDGVPSELVFTTQFHLFEQILIKLSRFAASNLTHEDSVHDIGVISAIIESVLANSEAKEEPALQYIEEHNANGEDNYELGFLRKTFRKLFN